MEKVLVAGGAGFIGANLCRSLLRNHEVVCMDDYSSGRKRNVEGLLGSKGFSIIDHNIIEPLDERFKGLSEVKYVFNMASRASPPDYQGAAMHTVWSNTLGTRNLLELCRKKGARFLFASTSEVYGDPLEHPQKETYRGNVNPIGVRACYDESKRLGETITFIYLRDYGVDARIIRIFNTYGPGMKSDDGRVVSNFITQALQGKDLTIYGDGKQTRSFCYIDDMVSGIEKAMFMQKTRGEVINLGNPDEFTVLELAEKVRKLVNPKAKFIYKDLPQDDPCRRNPDISKAKKLLGWQPKVKLDEGLAKTTDYFRKEL